MDDSIHSGSLNELLSYLNNGGCHNHLCYACRVYCSIELHTCDNPTHFDSKEHFVGHNQLPDLNRQFLRLRTLSLKWGCNVGANLSWKDWFSSHENYKQYHDVKRTEGRIWTLMFGCKGLSVKMGGKLPQKMMFMAQCIKKKNPHAPTRVEGVTFQLVFESITDCLSSDCICCSCSSVDTRCG